MQFAQITFHCFKVYGVQEGVLLLEGLPEEALEAAQVWVPELAVQSKFLFLNGPSPASFSFIFGLFQTNINTILQQINVKNVHPVYGTGIRTHDLQNMSLLP